MIIIIDNSNIVEDKDVSFNIKNIRGVDCYFLTKNQDLGYSSVIFRVEKVENVPMDFEPYKYCYTVTKGFYPNPNWVEPKPVEKTYTLDEAATILAKEVSK